MRRARVGVLGLTFKENVPDLRNSRVPDILRELASFGIAADGARPAGAARGRAAGEYGHRARRLDWMAARLDALVLAVPHRAYRELARARSRRDAGTAAAS